MKTIAKSIGIDVWGESHSERIGVRMRGFPIGEEFSLSKLDELMARRSASRLNELDDTSEMLREIAALCATPRHEADEIVFDEGVVVDGDTAVIASNEISAYIDNTDINSKDYDKLRTVLRPGHADLGAYLKYGEVKAGGGQFSGRMTALICIAGGIAKQLLANRGIEIRASIDEIGAIRYEEDSYDSREAIIEAIESARSDGDSLGGIVKLAVVGYPGGVGGALLEGLEGDLARAMYAIPSVKGVEFGSGFYGSRLRGSENNDEYHYEGGRVVTWTNRQGGISGGISTGMDITMRLAFKPVPSIGRAQVSVDVETGEEITLEIGGRHDICVVPRVLPIVEAMVALVLYDRLISG